MALPSQPQVYSVNVALQGKARRAWLGSEGLQGGGQGAIVLLHGRGLRGGLSVVAPDGKVDGRQGSLHWSTRCLCSSRRLQGKGAGQAGRSERRLWVHTHRA